MQHFHARRPAPPPPPQQPQSAAQTWVVVLGRSRNKAGIVLDHLYGLVMIHGLLALINMQRWRSLCVLPVVAVLGSFLDCGRSLDGSPLGSAFNVMTVLKITAMVRWVCPMAWQADKSELNALALCAGAAGYFLTLFICNLFFCHVATRTTIIVVYVCGYVLGVAFMACELWHGLSCGERCKFDLKKSGLQR